MARELLLSLPPFKPMGSNDIIHALTYTVSMSKCRYCKNPAAIIIAEPGVIPGVSSLPPNAGWEAGHAQANIARMKCFF